MQLSSQIAELLQSYSQLADLDTNFRDGRRARRITYRTVLRMSPVTEDGPGPFEDVQLRDFSIRGVCIVCARPTAQGSQFVLEFPRENGSVAHILSTVVYCRKIAESDAWSVGAEFTCCVPNPADANRREVERIRHSLLDPD